MTVLMMALMAARFRAQMAFKTHVIGSGGRVVRSDSRLSVAVTMTLMMMAMKGRRISILRSDGLGSRSLLLGML